MMTACTMKSYASTLASVTFLTMGIGTTTLRTKRAACENLIEKLLSFISVKEGKILDVACGKGETVRYLLNYYKPQNITGINLSEKQLETCRHKVPGVTFLRMDAATLNFPDDSYNNMLCVEAVFHFHTREKFLQEAYRVLKRQGSLVLTDILLTDWGKSHRLWWVDEANAALSDLKAYAELYQRIGFQEVEIIDATRECWVGLLHQSGPLLL